MAILSKSKLRQDSIIRTCNRRRWTKKRTQWTQIRLLAIRLEPCSGNGIFSPRINSMIQGANPPPFDRIRSCPGKHSPTSRSTVATSSQSFPHAVKTYTGITKTSVGKISSNDSGGCKPSLFVLYWTQEHMKVIDLHHDQLEWPNSHNTLGHVWASKLGINPITPPQVIYVWNKKRNRIFDYFQTSDPHVSTKDNPDLLASWPSKIKSIYSYHERHDVDSQHGIIYIYNDIIYWNGDLQWYSSPNSMLQSWKQHISPGTHPSGSIPKIPSKNITKEESTSSSIKISASSHPNVYGRSQKTGNSSKS